MKKLYCECFISKISNLTAANKISPTFLHANELPWLPKDVTRKTVNYARRTRS